MFVNQKLSFYFLGGQQAVRQSRCVFLLEPHSFVATKHICEVLEVDYSTGDSSSDTLAMPPAK